MSRSWRGLLCALTGEFRFRTTEPIPLRGNNPDVKISKDRRLLQRLARGDLDALGSLYDRHARLLAFRLRRDGASPETNYNTDHLYADQVKAGRRRST